MRAFTLIAGLGLVLSLPAFADPLNGSVEVSTSVSNAYDARSVFTNPAALGFQTELNGAQLLSSFTYDFAQNGRGSGSSALVYGNLGLGIEKLNIGTGSLMRYTFAGGVPITDNLFVGSRLALNRSDSVGFESLDFGAQFRAFPFLSIGAMANRVNSPTPSGSPNLPAQFVGGITVRPWTFLELAADADTLFNGFGKHWGYQASVSVEPVRGLKLRVGYHDEFKTQFGLQWNLDWLSLYTVAQPSAGDKRVITGFQQAAKPYPSAVAAANAFKVEVDGNLSEESVRGGLFSKDRPSLLDMISALEEIEKNDSIKLVLLKIDNFPLGLAAAQDLFEALWRVRDKGKQVEAFLSSGGIKEYLIASAANKIHLEPSGELRFLGLKSERYYLKGTMDKIGVEGEFLAKGEYKSAPEMFTRKGSSPLSKETSLEELEKLEEALLPLLTKGRGIDASRWKTMTATALYSAPEALAAKLVDTVEHQSKEMEKIRRGFRVTDSVEKQSDLLSLPPRVAVIVAQGDILQTKVQLLSLGGVNQVTPKRMESHFRRALADSRTKAIVLRVSSPGGEVLASHQIAALIENARQKKPVIVSMGDVAASGGYMISAPAERIFAQPLTVTGSIGVFLGKFNLGQLYKKLDLQKEILSHSPNAGLFSEDRPWTEEQRQILVRRLNAYYDSFVAFVSQNRHLSKEDAEGAAKGRVWVGNQAIKLKLVDERGGLREAIRFAAVRSGIAEKGFETWQLEESAGLFPFGGEGGFLSRLTAPDLSFLSSEAWRQLHWMSHASEEPFLYLAPMGKFP